MCVDIDRQQTRVLHIPSLVHNPVNSNDTVQYVLIAGLRVPHASAYW